MPLSFVGFIVAAPAVIALRRDALALGLFYATVPIAGVIWGLSLAQILRRVPPAPLRPLLAMHLSPAALFAIVATAAGQDGPAMVFLAILAMLALVLAASFNWIGAAGFSPLWGAFTFPLAAGATALLIQGGGLAWAGLGLGALALGVVPTIAFRVLRLWPGGKLAARTNAAQA